MLHAAQIIAFGFSALDALGEAEETEIQPARAEIDAHRNRVSAASRPVPAPGATPVSQQERNKQLWGSAMMEALAEIGMPVRPAAS